MKKVCAKKIVSGVLSVAMLLSASVSAMAATATSVVKYNADQTEYTITTDVVGVASGEMVTYMVHDASNFYSITPANIEYVDQKTAATSSAQFTYKGAGNWNELATAGMKIYVGAESLSAPLTTDPTVTEAKTTVFVNGVMDNTAVVTNDAIDGGYKYEVVNASVAPYVVAVYLNSDKVDFYRTGDSIGLFTDRELTTDDNIKLTTRAVVYSAKDYYESSEYANAFLTLKDTINANWEVVYNNGDSSTFPQVARVINNNQDSDEPSNYKYVNTKTFGEIYGKETVNWTATMKNLTGVSEVFLLDWNDESKKIETQRQTAYGYDGTGDLRQATSYNNPEPGTYTFDMTDFIPQGINLSTSGNAVEVSVSIPVGGNYKLLTHASAFAPERKVVAELYNDADERVATFKSGGTKDVFGYALSDGEINVPAGSYTIKLKGEAGLVRLDYMAFLPATEATNAAVAGGDATVESYIDNSVAMDDINMAIEIGNVRVTNNALVVFARATGSFSAAGIMVNGVQYPALAVSGVDGYGHGGFAIELCDETNDVSDLTNAAVEAYVIDPFDEVLKTGSVTPTPVQ